MSVKGTLIPIGGNEDKGNGENERYTLEYIQNGILSRVVRESGGIEAIIIVIPTASSIPVEVSENYLEAFSKLDCKNVFVMDIRSREDAEKPEFVELMQKANCVMFTGGDQSKNVKYIGGTVLDKIIKDKYENEAFVIAGTSAGAMCMSEEMITGGGVQEAFTKGAVNMGRGMSYIPNFIIDSHFIKRGRFGRLAEAMAKFPMKVGIGLAEDTGLIIKNGNNCEVIGSGMVILFDPRRLIHNNRDVVPEGAPMSITNLKVHILANGDKLDIKEKQVFISPIHLEMTDVETL
ncbi:cyanophycinase [Aequorivita sp. F47161]|uniref:Cyanophycinase n=1 Tax=Aequorivita vitellina TaxID=2874475 RepID=A0A9X1QR12_9FLAO|nr:cyanophycinase [Aequorivita vitellina]MCG2417716.1 cyanophycinase [Aequorivita vitellina]